MEARRSWAASKMEISRSNGQFDFSPGEKGLNISLQTQLSRLQRSRITEEFANLLIKIGLGDLFVGIKLG